MNEAILQDMSRALIHLVFRSGIVEELHSEGRCLDNETMKILNKDINNRMYTYLSACFGGDEIELEKFDKTINYLAKYYGKDWDKAEKMEILMDL